MQKRIKNGLDKVQASIVDIDQSSLFDIFIPKQLRLGKNEIKIRLVNDNTLLKGSEVLIDVLDQFGNPLYFEISNIANEDKTRSIIVFVFENDQGGRGQLLIYGKLSSTSDYLCKINLEINPRLETEQEIKFDNPPEIFYQEKRIPVQNITSQTRLLYKSGSNSRFSTLSPIIPKQLQPGIFDVERQELKTQISNGNVTNGIASSSLVQIPEYSNLGIITAENFIFSSSFKGGQIWVRNLNLEIPNDSLTTTPFLNQVYSASIVEVLSTSSIQVYPPFNLKVEYQSQTGLKTKVYDRFINEGNVTSSYFDVLTLSQGSYTQSYAVFDIFDLEPKSGKVDSIDISFKNLSLVGDNYEPLGNFKVKAENILIDKNNLSFDPNKGIVEKQIGELNSGFETYWQTSSLPNLIPNNEVPNGVILRNKQILELKSNYSPQVSKNSEWILSFDYFSEPSQSLDPQLDIYISGSEIKKLTNETLILYTPSQSQQLGTYVGSVTNNRGKTELHFEVKQKSKITPKIRPTNGLWSIGNIKLRPNEKNGFTAKQTRIFAPLTIPTGSELNFKIEYINPIGQKTTNFSSLLPGVYFEGSRGIVSSGGSTTIPPGTVSGSDQLTSSFDNRYERKVTGIVSSSNQIKDLLPSGTTSGSEQLTGSYDLRYERKGTGIFSSSGQLGPTGIYSGSGLVPHNTIVTASNLRIVTDNLDGFKSGMYFERGYSDVINDLIDKSGSITFINSNTSSDSRVYWEINDEEKTFKFGNFIPNGWHIEHQMINGVMYLIAHTASFTDNHVFEFGPDGIIFSHGGINKDGIKYGGDYSASLMTNNRSLPDIGTVKLMLTQSVSYLTSSFDSRYELRGNGIVSSSQQIKNLLPTGVSSGSEQFTSSYDARYERKGTGIVSSSQQIKNLLPTNVISGSEQLTGSYDQRYHRLGTGLLSSSNQISSDISGSFTNLSSSFQSRITVFETKTLVSGSDQLSGSYDLRYERKGTGIFSSSNQVDYNSITNKMVVANSGLHRLLISSGSTSSSSYADSRLTYDIGAGKMTITGSLYITGSTSTRFSYIWDGPKVADTTTPGIVWTNMQNIRNVWLGRGGLITFDANYIGDFTEITEGRLYTAMQVAGAGATCSIEVQYSTDQINWNSLLLLTIGNTPGSKDTGWVRTPAGSQGFCYIRLTGYGGDGVTDPRFSPPIALFR